MGKVKQMCLDNEEKFYDLVSDIVSDCDSVQECLSRVEIQDALDLVSHLSEEDVSDIVNDLWTEYWWKYQDNDK